MRVSSIPLTAARVTFANPLHTTFGDCQEIGVVEDSMTSNLDLSSPDSDACEQEESLGSPEDAPFSSPSVLFIYPFADGEGSPTRPLPTCYAGSVSGFSCGYDSAVTFLVFALTRELSTV